MPSLTARGPVQADWNRRYWGDSDIAARQLVLFAPQGKRKPTCCSYLDRSPAKNLGDTPRLYFFYPDIPCTPRDFVTMQMSDGVIEGTQLASGFTN
jgi:hypothetical protein